MPAAQTTPRAERKHIRRAWRRLERCVGDQRVGRARRCAWPGGGVWVLTGCDGVPAQHVAGIAGVPDDADVSAPDAADRIRRVAHHKRRG